MIKVKKNNFLFNKEVYKCLNNIIKKESIANGYIFYGAEGVGKKQTALQFIKDIFKQYSPSGNIDEKITNNNHPDFLIVEPSSLSESKKVKSSNHENTTKSLSEVIKVSQIREIKSFLGQKSINSEKKIILIIDAHLLNEAASNCLLKTLEEPSNGIFILLTSNLNLLLDTIISRCQLVRFRPFSSKQMNSFLKDYIDYQKFNNENFNIQDLINSANGSPGKLSKNIEIWNELSVEITRELHYPIKNNLNILEISKLISEQLEIYEQVFLANFIQIIWWRKTKNIDVVKKLEHLKFLLRKKVQPRLSWEITFLKISMLDI